MQQGKQRILGFDIARVFSMFYVIAVYHILGYTTILYHNPLILSLVYSSLGTFTFLSSFLLTSRYSFEGREAIVLFYKKRVLRIYPLFLISSVLLLIIGFNDITSTIKGLLGISPLWGPHPRTLWYVSMLLLFYAVTPLLSKGTLIKKVSTYLVLNFLFAILSVSLSSVNIATFVYFAIYFIGVIIGSHYKEKVMAALFEPKLILVSLVILFLIAINLFVNNNYYRIISGSLGIFAFLNISCLLGGGISEKYKHFKRIVEFASYASMCAYLFHREIFETMLTLYHPQKAFLLVLYLLFVGVPIVLVLSYFIQRYYDSAIKKLFP